MVIRVERMVVTASIAGATTVILIIFIVVVFICGSNQQNFVAPVGEAVNGVD